MCVCVCVCVRERDYVFNTVVSLRSSLSPVHAISCNRCCVFTEKADMTAQPACNFQFTTV